MENTIKIMAKTKKEIKQRIIKYKNDIVELENSQRPLKEIKNKLSNLHSKVRLLEWVLD
jgi:ribosomal protein S7